MVRCCMRLFGEVGDLSLGVGSIRHGYTGEEYLKAVTDQFETLYSESQKLARVMGFPLHPFLTGQPLHIKYFQQAIAHMQRQDRVWFATGNEIAEAYERLQ